MEDHCTFCGETVGSKVVESKSLYAIYDKYPVNLGHLLLISKRHVPDIFSLDDEEFHELRLLLDQVRHMLDGEFNPAGYNIGVNCGAAAGQTIPHFHMHIIPRYPGDIADPRGGIRNIKTPLVPYP